MPLHQTEVQFVNEHECPNCNATARVVCERRKPTTPLWEVYIVCGKCKGKFPVGLMHNSEKFRIDRRRVLVKKYDKAKTPRERGRIFEEIKRLEREEQEWNASL